MDEPLKLISSQKAAERLGLSRQTFIRGVDAGQYPVRAMRTPGGHRRFNADDVDALVAELTGAAS